MKVVTIVGARPQFIKGAAVSRALKPHVSEILVHTGQHYDNQMSDIFFRELDISSPRYNLNIGSGRHGEQTGRMLAAIEEVLLAERPAWVLVYGDTNSTLAGALAAAKVHIPVAHVEAGLRSFNRRMPEELNRVLTDHLSNLLFVPTDTAVDNLRSEGIYGEKVHLVGDVMYDAALFYGERAEQSSDILSRLNLRPRTYVLATVHRAENTDDIGRLKAIFEGLLTISKEIPVILPLHPRTRRVLQEAGLNGYVGPGLHLIDPLGYLDMVMLEKNCRLVVTDSGGVQKEAFFYRVPCVTLRDETEWSELVHLGWNFLVPPSSPASVIEGIRVGLASMGGQEASPYGVGRASRLIAEQIMRHAVNE